MTGQRLKLRTTTVAIEAIDGRRVAVPVPAGEIVKVISKPSDDDRMVEVDWNGRNVVMFAIDVRERGEVLPQPQSVEA